ncbi:hypothetical protein GGR39_002757 [Novosphingobium fluoreni]|uniref:Uncharacterized protein n=1 Tax=Novosphingobium fluoreni TaxID=1391222 RepID=A0A7W6C062_9SPHN|nr:hypothetical protein [Novosphingobium fluoreni]
MTAGLIVSLISIFGALILVTRRQRWRQMPRGNVIRLALIWVALIVGVTAIVSVLGIRVAP